MASFLNLSLSSAFCESSPFVDQIKDGGISLGDFEVFLFLLFDLSVLLTLSLTSFDWIFGDPGIE